MSVGCESIRDDLPLYAAAELAGERRHTVERHLQECADCRAEQELLVLLRTPLRAPPALAARVRRAVAATPVRGWPVLARAALAAGITAVAVTASLLVVRDDGEPVVATAAIDATALGWAARTDPLLHGGPGLELLSDQELELLLEEIQS